MKYIACIYKGYILTIYELKNFEELRQFIITVVLFPSLYLKAKKRNAKKFIYGS